MERQKETEKKRRAAMMKKMAREEKQQKQQAMKTVSRLKQHYLQCIAVLFGSSFFEV